MLMGLVGCGGGTTKDCKELLATPLVDLPPHAFRKACAGRFAPACAKALESELAGDEIFATCTRAYSTIAPTSSRADWFATAIDRRDLTDGERRNLGMALESELAPPAIVVHLRDAAIEVADKSYPLTAAAEIDAALRANGAAQSGLLIWGASEAPAAYAALSKLVRAGNYGSVMCTPKNCR